MGHLVARMARAWTLCLAGALLAVVVAFANGEDELSPINLGAAEAIGRRAGRISIRRGAAVAATAGNFYVDSAIQTGFQGNHEEEDLGEASGSTPPPADQDDDAADEAAVTKTADQPAHQTSSPPPPTSASDELTVQQSAALSSDMALANEHGIVDTLFMYQLQARFRHGAALSCAENWFVHEVFLAHGHEVHSAELKKPR